MDQNQEIISELKSINQKMEKFTKPSKSMGLNFLNGMFHSLGTVFGTIIVAGLFFYVFSKLNLNNTVSKWMEDAMSQINWNRVVAPQIQQFQTIEEKIIEN